MEDGSTVWSLSLSNTVLGFLFSGDAVFVLTNNDITAVNATTGKVLWEYLTSALDGTFSTESNGSIVQFTHAASGTVMSLCASTGDVVFESAEEGNTDAAATSLELQYSELASPVDGTWYVTTFFCTQSRSAVRG